MTYETWVNIHCGIKYPVFYFHRRVRPCHQRAFPWLLADVVTQRTSASRSDRLSADAPEWHPTFASKLVTEDLAAAQPVITTPPTSLESDVSPENDVLHKAATTGSSILAERVEQPATTKMDTLEQVVDDTPIGPQQTGSLPSVESNGNTNDHASAPGSPRPLSPAVDAGGVTPVSAGICGQHTPGAAAGTTENGVSNTETIIFPKPTACGTGDLAGVDPGQMTVDPGQMTMSVSLGKEVVRACEVCAVTQAMAVAGINGSSSEPRTIVENPIAACAPVSSPVGAVREGGGEALGRTTEASVSAATVTLATNCLQEATGNGTRAEKTAEVFSIPDVNGAEEQAHSSSVGAAEVLFKTSADNRTGETQRKSDEEGATAAAASPAAALATTIDKPGADVAAARSTSNAEAESMNVSNNVLSAAGAAKPPPPEVNPPLLGGGGRGGAAQEVFEESESGDEPSLPTLSYRITVGTEKGVVSTLKCEGTEGITDVSVLPKQRGKGGVEEADSGGSTDDSTDPTEDGSEPDMCKEKEGYEGEARGGDGGSEHRRWREKMLKFGIAAAGTAAAVAVLVGVSRRR